MVSAEREERKPKKMMEKMKRESPSKKVIFAVNENIDSELAFSGVFPDDFSVVLNRNTGMISNLVGKHIVNNSRTEWFDCLVDVNNELVEISKLEVKSIAELELKLDLYNLVWE